MTGSFFYILEKESVEPHTPLNLPMRRYISYRGWRSELPGMKKSVHLK